MKFVYLRSLIKELGQALLVLALLTVIFLPRFTDESRQTVFDMHRRSMCIIPAVYLLDKTAIPGVDFRPQYGVGQSFFCAKLLADEYITSVQNFDYFNCGMKVFFFIALYFFLGRLFRTKRALFLTGAAILSVQSISWIIADKPLSPWTLKVPSVGLYRHSFIPILWLAWVGYANRRHTWTWLLLLSMIAGLQLFWITDTGIAAILATAAALFLFADKALERFIAPTVFVALSFCMTGMWGVLCYGPRFLKIDLPDLLGYISFFSSGLGGVLTAWTYDPLHLFMNIVSGMMLTVTVVLCLTEKSEKVAKIIGIVALYGLVTRLKWVNNSAAHNFLGDSFSYIIVGCYGLSLLLPQVRSLALTRAWVVKPWIKNLGAVLALFLLWDINDHGRFQIYSGFKSYLGSDGIFELPHILKQPSSLWDGTLLHDINPKGAYTSDLSDRQLIEKAADEHHKIMILSYDLATLYHLESKVPPQSNFLPHEEIILLNDLKKVKSDILSQDYLVASISPQDRGVVGQREDINQMLATNFAEVQRSKNLILFKRN